MRDKFDIVRLAEMRDAHAALTADYQRCVIAVADAALQAARARLNAPALPGAAPTAPSVTFAPGIPVTTKPVLQPRPRTNEFYKLPLATMLSFSEQQLEDAQVDRRAMSEIVVAEKRAAKLRTAHATKAAAVRQSAAAMKNINLFASEQRL